MNIVLLDKMEINNLEEHYNNGPKTNQLMYYKKIKKLNKHLIKH